MLVVVAVKLVVDKILAVVVLVEFEIKGLAVVVVVFVEVFKFVSVSVVLITDGVDEKFIILVVVSEVTTLVELGAFDEVTV